MALSDALSYLLVPRRPVPRLPLAPGTCSRLLLLRLDGIGDNVCSFPALEMLRRGLPDAHITLAVGPWAAPLYRECPWINELVEWDTALYGVYRNRGIGGLSCDLEMVRTLRRRGFDAGIDLRGDLRSIIPLWLIAPPARIAGISCAGKRLLSDPLPSPGGPEAGRAAYLARRALGLPAAPPTAVRDWPRPRALERARARLDRAGWDPGAPSVALCPLALWPWKQWPGSRFQELAGRLKGELGLQVVWFLERPEQAAAYALGDPVFCGPLDEAAAALGLCRLAVSNDSALMHLAVAAGCRTVQLFGPGEAARFAHTGAGVALLHDGSCPHYPCTQRGSCENRSAGWCLERIGGDAVFASCAALLAADPGRQG